MATGSSFLKSTLATLPLEIRYLIYDFASNRRSGSYLILKQYLEKVDPDITTEQEADSDEEDADESSVEEDMGADDVESDEGDEVMDDDDDSDEDGSEDQYDGEYDEEEPDSGEVSTVISSCSRPRGYGRHTTYRHMLPIIKLSRCPPPINLLQLCKQFELEATEYYRNKVILTIDVNSNFQHLSFFEETLEKFMSSSFSPLEHMRRVHLIFTWDSEWLREKTKGAEPMREIDPDTPIFLNYYFGERVNVVCKLLEACPELREVTIDVHDTEDTPDARRLMAEQLTKIVSTTSTRTYWKDKAHAPYEIHCVRHHVQEFYSAPGTTHARNSPLASRRAEFDLLLRYRFAML